MGFPTLQEGGWKLWALNAEGFPRCDAHGKLQRRNLGPGSFLVSPELQPGLNEPVLRLWDVEGESDLLAAVDVGMIHLIAPTSGASSLAPYERHGSWLCALKPEEVAIVRDLDSAGRSGAGRVAEWWRRHGVPVRVVSLPESLGVGGDLRDYLATVGGPADLDALADESSLQPAQ